LNADSDTGVVTILFTDIESSTRLWEQDRERMSRALAGHDAAARAAVEGHQGSIVKTMGDGLLAIFIDPVDALNAALKLQVALADTTATCGVALNVRCGLHSGVVERRDHDIFGTPVNRATRIMGAAHGGQVLLSEALFEVVRQRLPARTEVLDLGRVRLRDLSKPERVYQLLHPQLRRDFPPLRGLEATPNNLPRQVSSFVGRERELAEVIKLMGETALLTLAGAGGLGKTRLSVQVASAVKDDYPDGVWFVDLAPVGEATLVPQTVAGTLGIKEDAGRPVLETIVKHIGDLRLLLILDNCEHLVGACAELAMRLLRAGPGVKVLATSREPLRIEGETTYQVPALAVPHPGNAIALTALGRNEAVRLFIDRAVAARPSFRLTEQNAAAVTDICHRLDGIPLALELAAARVRAFSVETIAERLSDRFELLVGGDRTAMPRQQTLRAAIDWSYDLLTEPERALLRGLSVFAGGWTLDGAEVVASAANIAAAEVLDLLNHLVDKSLVIARDASGGIRHHMLETVRQYGNAKLRESNESDLYHDAHLSHFRQVAEAAEPRLRDAGQREWLGRLQTESDNLRAALEWACSAGKTRSALALARVLGRFWHIRGDYREGRYWLARVQDLRDAPAYRDDLAWVFYFEGVMALFTMDTKNTQRCLTLSLEAARACGNRRCAAYALDFLGFSALMEADFGTAHARFAECETIFREIGDLWGIAFCLYHAGAGGDARGDSAGALALWEQSLAILQKIGDEHRAGILMQSIGGQLVRNGEIERGADLLRQALRIAAEQGAKLSIACALWEFAEAAEQDASPQSARELFQAAMAVFDSVGIPIGSDRPGMQNLVQPARARGWLARNRAQYERAVADKRVLSMDEAIELALGYQFETVSR
jgi:predicted ATPase/class 3 adenylate cyclase